MATLYFPRRPERPSLRHNRLTTSQPILRRRLALNVAALCGLALLHGCGAVGQTTTSRRATRSIQPLAAESIALGETRPVGVTFKSDHIAPAHATWVAMIDRAQTHLDIGQFYVANRPGTRLELVIKAIERAARRGVKVRLLVDTLFAKKYPKSLARLGAHVAVRRFDVKAHMGGVLYVKYFVVDRKIAWLGSQNFDWRSLAHIHEIGLRLHVSAAVKPLQATFDYDWALATKTPGKRPFVDHATLPQPIFTPAKWSTHKVFIAPVGSPVGYLPRGMAWELPALVRWLDGAKSTVRLQLLSMHRRARDSSDFPMLFEALRRAARRGVKVSILLAHWSKSRRSSRELSALQREAGITVRFATIPQHDGGFIPFARVIHSKYLVVDQQKTWIGTSNWSKGYFYGSRNVGVLVQGKAFAAALVEVFQGLWEGPMAETLVPDKAYPRPRVAR